MPEIDLSIYPHSGRQRIVEILLDYPLERSELEKRRDELALELGLLARELAGGREPRAVQAARALLREGRYDPEGGSTPYDFFYAGSADSEGFSLAYAALCQELGLSCRVARGALDGEPRFWAVVQTVEGWRHLDPAAGEEPSLYTDQEFQELGYLWEEGSLPACLPD